jgi:hypothetical protein
MEVAALLQDWGVGALARRRSSSYTHVTNLAASHSAIGWDLDRVVGRWLTEVVGFGRMEPCSGRPE